MGKSSSKKHKKAKRDASVPSLTELLSPLQPQLNTPIVSPKPLNLRAIEDRRTYHPQGTTRAARSVQKATHRLVVPSRPSKPNRSPKPTSVRPTAFQALSSKVGFEAPKQVLVCIRRKTRKQVLFALKRTGKGARRRHHRWSEYSGIRC